MIFGSYRGSLPLRNRGKTKAKFSTKLLSLKETNGSSVRHEYSKEALIQTWEHFLKEHYSKLRKIYKDMYVAILNDQVIDSDINRVTLAERVYSKYGYKPIFMPFIGKEKVLEMMSV